MILERLLEKYGQRVTVHYGGAAGGVETRAFVQTIQERGEDRWDRLPTPLGMTERRRLTYLGDPRVSLEDMGDGFVRYRGRSYRVQGAQPVYVGDRLSHWWALLVPGDEEDEE